jgi:hypothetical protein
MLSRLCVIHSETLKFKIFLPLPPSHWDYKCMQLYPVKNFFQGREMTQTMYALVKKWIKKCKKKLFFLITSLNLWKINANKALKFHKEILTMRGKILISILGGIKSHKADS